MMTPCQDCGRQDNLMAMVPTQVWMQICPEDGILCLWCIDKRCSMAGLTRGSVRVALTFLGEVLDGVDGRVINQAEEQMLFKQKLEAQAARMPGTK